MNLILELNPIVKSIANITPTSTFIFFAGLGLTMVPILGIMVVHQKSSDVKKH